MVAGTDGEAAHRLTRTGRPVILLWLVAIVVFVLDRLSKAYILSHEWSCQQREIIPHLLRCRTPTGRSGCSATRRSC